MYLSRLILNPRSRQVQRELADPYEMHRTVCRGFPEDSFIQNEPSGVLFRLDLHPRTGVPILFVQSVNQPNWSFLLDSRKNYLLGPGELSPGMENPAMKPFDLQLAARQMFAFRLRANPTVKKDREGNRQGRRVGLYREKDQMAWLETKIKAAGSNLISAYVSGKANLRGKLFAEKDDEKRMRFVSVQFDGVLQVEDPDQLTKTITAGIGSAKGLGFGLLSLAPVRG